MSENLPAIAQEIAQIEPQIGTPAWWQDEPLQQRYRGLLDARDGGAPLPATRTEADKRITEIETLMRDPKRSREYWRNPAIQQEYQRLLAQREGVPEEGSPAADGWVIEPQRWLASLPAAAVQDWREQPGGTEGGLIRLQTAVLGIAAGLEEQVPIESFFEGFGRLPERVRAAVLIEAGRPEPGYVQPATDGELAAFKRLYGGQQTLESWGRDGRRKSAVALERFNRAHERMSASERSIFGRWFREIAPRAQQLFLWSLGN